MCWATLEAENNNNLCHQGIHRLALGIGQVNRNLQQGMLVLEKREAQGILGAQAGGNSPGILLF